MTFRVITRLATGLALLATTVGAARFTEADLKGDYNVEFTVEGNLYTGTAKTTPGTKGAFTAKFDFTSPSPISADATGKTTGDSLTFDMKYVDTSRNCTGTVQGKGTVEKDGNKASGALAVNDSCGGETAGSFRLFR
jgi:hypothetical protein